MIACDVSSNFGDRCQLSENHTGQHVGIQSAWTRWDLPFNLTNPKLRYDLIPEPALAAMAHAFTVGTKHGDGIKVDSFATEYAAIMRHLEACRRGEFVDPDDGHLHLGAVMARCAKLIATGTKWEDE